MNTHRCCDNCIYYNWYYDRCNKYDCETDERSVCASFKRVSASKKSDLAVIESAGME